MNITGTMESLNIYGKFGLYDYIVFVFMLGISMGVGIYFGCFGQSTQTTEEYLLGGRRMKTWPIAISLIASQLSGISIMALPAETYSFGIQYWMIGPGIIITLLFINYISLPVFYNNHITNCYEYLEMRFCKTVRQILTAIFIINGYFLLPVMIFIPALALTQVTGINIHLINAIVNFVCVFYTMLGGIKAVVWTDVIQACIMLGSCILVITLAILRVGGFHNVIERAENGERLNFFNLDTNLQARHTFWNTVFGYAFLWCAYVGFNQSCVQRIVSVPTIQHAKRVIWIFGGGFLILMTLNCFTGIVMFAKYYDCDPLKAGIVSKADKLMPYFVQDIVGHLTGMPGLFISCVFSASLSTLSANMNSMSGIIYEDYIKPLKLYKHTDSSANLTMKVIVLLTGIYFIAMGLIVENFSQILPVVAIITGISQGIPMGVFSLALLWPWANKKGAIAASIGSFIILLWISIGHQILIQKGEISYEPLPTSIDNCESYGINVTNLIKEIKLIPSIDESFSIYKISFAWYGAIAILSVFIIGIAVSFFTRDDDINSLNPRLVSPIVHCFIPQSVLDREVELEIIDKNLINHVPK